MIAFGCSSDDDNLPPVQQEVFPCKIMKCGQVNIFNNSGTIDTVMYQVHFEYENDRIIKRLNYGYVSVSTGFTHWQLKSTDSLVYDDLNRVTRIYYDIYHLGNSPVRANDHFFYDGIANQPFKREHISYWVDDPDNIEKLVENIHYDFFGRISNTQLTHIYPDDVPGITETSEKNYAYDESGNLVTSVENFTYNYMTTTILSTSTTNYSNYDSHKNPYRSIKVPFADLRDLNYSYNNPLTREYISNHEGDVSGTSTHTLDYNEHDYPLFAEYECQ